MGITEVVAQQPTEYYGARVVSALSFAVQPVYANLPLSFGLSPRIWREVRDFNPDIIHVSTPGVMVVAANLYSRLLRLPLVYSYHTHLPAYMAGYGLSLLTRLLWALIRTVVSFGTMTLVTSDAMKEALGREGVSRGIPMEVWKRGVDTDIFHPKFKCRDTHARFARGGRKMEDDHDHHRGSDPDSPAPPSSPASAAPFVLGYVGRLGHEKNLTFLTEVLDRLPPHVSLVFVGDGPARSTLEATFARFGSRVHFAGMQQGEALSTSYASLDCFVMPSESETLGFVVLEAMASAVPVVCVNAGGIPDILARGGKGEVGGYLYESGDVDACVTHVKSLMTMSDDERCAVGGRGRKEVSKWDWRAATKHLLTQLYPVAVAEAKKVYGDLLGVCRLPKQGGRGSVETEVAIV